MESIFFLWFNLCWKYTDPGFLSPYITFHSFITGSFISFIWYVENISGMFRNISFGQNFWFLLSFFHNNRHDLWFQRVRYSMVGISPFDHCCLGTLGIDRCRKNHNPSQDCNSHVSCFCHGNATAGRSSRKLSLSAFFCCCIYNSKIG